MNSSDISLLFTPDYSHITGLLQHLNDDELKDILNSEEKTNEIIKDLKQVKDLEAEREMLVASNRSISEYNLSKKPELIEMSKELEENYKRALELKEKVMENKRKLENKVEVQSKDTLLALLQAATREIEDEAEAVVDAFLGKKEVSVDDFIEKYLELRKLAHLRRIKAEKLAKILQDERNGFGTPPERPNRLRKPPAPPTPRNPTSLPYPNPNANAFVQNIPTVPARPAPQPPFPVPQNNPYRGSFFPNQQGPFTYVSPYPVHPVPQPPQYPRFN